MKFFLIFLCLFALDTTHAQSQENVLVMGNYTSLCLGEAQDFITQDSLPKDLTPFKAIMLFSGSTSKLDADDIDRIAHYVENGGGLYSGAEDWPLQAESNQLTNRFYKKESYGKFEQVNAEKSVNNGNLEILSTDSIPAGKTTVAFPLDYRLKVDAWVDDQPLILSGNIGDGRIIIDGGYSRFYCLRSNESSQNIMSKMITFLVGDAAP